MNEFKAIFKRELRSYFSTPIGYVFIVVFLVALSYCTFEMGQFYEQDEANLSAFFRYLPYLYVFFIPAVAMRLWSEERQSGTVELLFTLPVTMRQAILGKFFAAWVFIGISLALTFPMIITVTYLGDPDWWPMITGYFGAFLMAGGYLAIGCFCSAMNRSQVISFILTVLICLIFLSAGSPTSIRFFAGWLPEGGVEFLASLSILTHFESIQRGVIEFKDLAFFIFLITGGLYCGGVMLSVKKAD